LTSHRTGGGDLEGANICGRHIPASGREQRTRLFVLTLDYSRKSVRSLTFRSSTRIWVELHERAFRRLGGVTRVVVLGNLGEGVLAADIYDPTLKAGSRIEALALLLGLRTCVRKSQASAERGR
jgi:hypothetical protein